MKKYLNTFRGNLVATKFRRYGFFTIALLFSLVIAMYFAVSKTFDNQFLALFIDLLIGFTMTTCIDLTMGIGRQSPLLNNKQKIISDETIFNLAMHQNNPMLHPYTCDRRAKECEVNQVPRDFSKDGVLIPTKDGWVCPCGKYKQKIL